MELTSKVFKIQVLYLQIFSIDIQSVILNATVVTVKNAKRKVFNLT